MDIRIERIQQLKTFTLGALTIDGAFECFVREEVVRADRVFIAGESALPLGRYNVSIVPCRRYGGLLPLLVSTQRWGGLQGVPIGMRIHPGNHVHELYAGIVVGQEQGPKAVYRTKAAFEALMHKLRSAVQRAEAIDCEIGVATLKAKPEVTAT